MQIKMSYLNPNEINPLIDSAKTLTKTTADALHMVLYTDGGFRPHLDNTGGWGVHGYIYTKDTPKNGHGCTSVIPQEKGYVPINSELSTGKGSVPPINVIKYVDAFGGTKGMTSNNEAELLALSNALDIVETIKPISVHFLLDSEYVLKGANEWIDKWKANNWLKPNGTIVSNKEHWLTVDQMLKRINENTDITWEWVKGHSGNMGNETADMNATSGLYAAKNTSSPDYKTFTFTPVKEFWKPDYDSHCLIMTPFWYFLLGADAGVTDTPVGKRHVYWTGTEGRRDNGKFVGNPDSDLAYCVVLTADRLDVLENVRMAQNRAKDRGFGYTVVIGHLDNVLSSQTHRHIVEHGPWVLGNHHRENSVLMGNGDVMSHTLEPAYKALRAIEQLESQERRLLSILCNDVIDYYTLTDITNLIYDEVEVKKVKGLKVKPDLGGDTASIIADVRIKQGNEIKTHSLRISFNIDAPRANAFSHFITKGPKIYVATWPEPESTKGFRCGLFIELSDTKEYALWESPYSNLRIHL